MMKRKLTAMILVLCMALSLLPGTVFAQEEPLAYNQFRVSYDMNGGSVYWSRGSSLPEGTEEDFLADGESTTNVNQANTVHFLFDTTRAVNREAWNNGEFVTYEPFEAADRSINVRVSYPTEDSWYSAIAVENGQAAGTGYSFENNVLSFKAEAAVGEINVDIWWTDHDFAFFNFEPNEGEILIDYQWNNEGEVIVDPGTTILRSCAQPEYSRTRFTVPDTTQSVSFTWSGHLRRLWVEGEGDENGWGEISGIGLSSYTYVLDRVNEFNDPWNHYGINFDFFWNWSCELQACYDVWGGLVYMGLGSGEPTELLYDNDWQSFEENGQLQPVRLRFDQEHGLDRGLYDQDGTIRYVESNVAPEDRLLFVYAEYTTADGDEIRDWIVEAGEAVMPGFTLANNILSFTPETGCEMRLEVVWSEAEYDFRNFGWDDDTLMIEFNAWGGGTVHWDEGVDVGTLLQPEYSRGKILLPLNTPQLSFTWDGHLRTLGVFGLDGSEWNQTEWQEPDFDSYTLSLNQTEPDGSPRRHYMINFDFADDNDWNFLFAANYDDNGGLVFYGVDEIPDMEPEDYLPRQGNGRAFWPDNISFRSGDEPGTIYLRFDPARCIDFEQWEQGNLVFRDSWESEDRAISVVAKYAGLDGSWHEELLVLYSEAVSARASYDGSLLSFTPESGYGVDFDIYWTFQDYEFSQFRPTEEKPVMVNVDWWGEGSIGIVNSLSDEDVMIGDGRLMVRLSREVSSLTLEWDMNDNLRCINVYGLGEDGEWLNGIEPYGNCYTLYLDQTDEWGNPRDWYHIQFEFEGNSMPDNGMLFVRYDANGGSVFRSLDYENYPEASAEYYEFDGQGFYFLDENGDSRDVRLLIDETKAIDWELLDSQGEIGFREPNWYENRCLIVYVRSSKLDGVVVWGGNLTEYGEYKGFSYSGGEYLIFAPWGSSEMEIKIYWTAEDYFFDMYQGTPEAPVVIQVDWWGDGQINLPEVPEENLYLEDNRARIRVPLDTESLTFTWDENDPLRQINVNGMQGYEDWCNDVPFEGNSYTLELNATWEDGNPRDWYHVQFEFENGGFQEDGMLISFYDQGKGSIFWALGEEELAADSDHYLGFGFERAVSYLEDGEILPVRLFFDETRAAFFDDDGELIGFEDAVELNDRAITVTAESIDYNGKIVDNGVLTELGQAHGYSFENNLLSFIPENEVYVLLHVNWCLADTEFDDFQPTEEYPVIVEYSWRNYGEIIPPEGIAPENILLQPGRARMRVAADTESLTFTWAEDYGVNRIEYSDVNYEQEWHEYYVDQSEPHSFTLYLDNEDDFGVYHYYILDFEFFPDSRYQLWIDWTGSEGNVYFGLDEIPEIGLEQYVFENPSFLTEDAQGNPRIGTVYLRLDHLHSISYFEEQPTELYDLGDWEGYDPSIWVEYVHDDGSWFEGFAVRHGQAAAPGFSFENDVLSFTPENQKPVIIRVFWSDDDMNYASFEGSEEKPVVVELLLGGRAPVELPELPAEDVLVWHAAEHDYVKLRVPESCAELSFGWACVGVIAMIEIDGAGENGERLTLYPPHGTSYTLELNQTEFGAAKQHYFLAFWAFGWPENPFVDVPENAWYRDAVILMKLAGITAGTSEDTFSPNQIATRAEAVTFLWRAYGSQEPTDTECGFTDLEQDAWYRDAVLWAVEKGITGGTSETTFSPNQVCNRAEIVTFLWRAAGSPTSELQSCPFLDVSEQDWYRDAVLWAYENGVTAGTSATSFSPTKSCTRAEISMFLFWVLMN